MTETLKTIKNWVKENYGDTTCYNLKALANEIDSRYKLKEIKSRLETLIQYRIERHSDEYFLYHEKGGFGETGCAKNEDVFDEVKAREDVIDECLWTEDEQIVELINKLLWEL